MVDIRRLREHQVTMKKIIALGLAGTFVAAAGSASVGTAEAAKLSAGGAAVVGVPTYPGYLGSSLDRHVAWCKAHYRSYRPPPIDAFLGTDGIWHRCISP